MAGISFKALVPLIVSALAFTGYSDANQSNPVDETRRAVSCFYPLGEEPVKPVGPSGGENVLDAGETKMTLHLTTGDAEITMDHSITPRTIDPFMSLMQQGRFDEARRHWLTDYGILVLQCGDPTGTGKGRPGYTIPNGLSPRTTGLEKEGSVTTYSKETVATANTDKPNTAEPQFLTVWEDSQLSPNHAVFDTADEGGLAVIQGVAA